MEWLVRQARARPEATAVRFSDPSGAVRRWGYGELSGRVARAAAALDDMGVRPGDRVAVVLPNCPEHLIALHAILWCGATVVPIDPRLTPGEQAALLERVEPRLVVVDPDEQQPAGGTWRRREAAEIAAAKPGPPPLEPAPVDPDRPLSILFTSGTTGTPKAVPLTWRNHEASAVASALNLGIAPDDDWLCCLPLCHTGGLAIALRSALYGTALTLHETFDPAAVAEAIAPVGGEAAAVTLASLVPTMLRRVLRAMDGCASARLRAVLIGGGPCDEALLRAAAEREIPALQTYGMTETGSQVVTMPIGRADKIGAAGLALHGVDLTVRDARGDVAARSQSGRIWVRGSMVTPGYLRCPEENRARFRAGWFDTGDYGRLDADGFLWVEARREDLILSGGKNVYPAEVEAALRAHPAVADVAVVPVDDPEWGQRVAAAVVVEAGGEVTVDVLDAFGRDTLAAYKVPRRWRLVDALPRTGPGKVDRAAVRALFEAPGSR